MKRIILFITLTIAGLATTHAADTLTDQKLIEQAAANRPPAQPSPSPSAGSAAVDASKQPAGTGRPASATIEDELTTEERLARGELALAQARVELVAAKKLLRAGRTDDAAKKAQRVLALLRKLPAELDAGEDYALQAEGIIARSKRARTGKPVTLSDHDAPIDSEPETVIEARAREAARIGRRFAGSDTPDVDTRGDAGALRDRAKTNQNPGKSGYHPAKEIIDERAIDVRTQERIRYEGALHDAIAEDEAARLTAAHEGRLAGDADVSYPDDWPERVARREQWKDGRIARGPSVTGPDGKEWFVGVYDLRDIAYEPPDFSLPFGIHPAEELRMQLDREALRWRSQIFGGYADDLAAGLPLLRYFGPVDDFEFRGPKYNPAMERMVERLVRMITDQRPTEPTAEPVPNP